MNNKFVYVITLDNGEAYEDHYQDNLFVVESEKVALEIVGKCNEFIKELDIYEDKPDTYDENFEKWDKETEDKIKLLKIPYDVEEIRGQIHSFYTPSCYLLYQKLEIKVEITP